MTETQLVDLWTRARWHIIVSQFAPTFLLTASVGFLTFGLGDSPVSVRIAAAGILLASGVLGAAAQIGAASEALAVIDDLRRLPSVTTVGGCIIALAPWVNIVRFGAPAVFVVVYIALLAALFLPD
jgi:hypothetical protein